MNTPSGSSKQSLPNSSTKNTLTPCRRVGLGRPSSGSLKKLVQVRTSTPPYSSPHISNQNSLPQVSKTETPASGLPSTFFTEQNHGQNKELGLHRVRRCLTKNLKPIKPQSEKRIIHDEYEVKSDTSIKPNKIGENCDPMIKKACYIDRREIKKPKSELSPVSRIAEREIGNKISFGGKTDVTKTTSDITFETYDEVPEENIVMLVASLLEKRKKLEQIKVQEKYANKHNLEELRAQTAKWRAAGQEALRHCVRLAGQVGYSVTIPQLMEQHGFPPDLMGYNADDDEFQ